MTSLLALWLYGALLAYGVLRFMAWFNEEKWTLAYRKWAILFSLVLGPFGFLILIIVVILFFFMPLWKKLLNPETNDKEVSW